MRLTKKIRKKKTEGASFPTFRFSRLNLDISPEIRAPLPLLLFFFNRLIDVRYLYFVFVFLFFFSFFFIPPPHSHSYPLMRSTLPVILRSCRACRGMNDPLLSILTARLKDSAENAVNAS